jgi:hypothetical protein
MKTRLLFTFLVISGFIVFFTSCEDCINGNGKMATRYIKVGDIRNINLSGDADIILVTDSTDSIKVEGESNVIDAYDFVQSGKSMKIKSSLCILRHETVRITIPVKVIEALTLNGSGNFIAEKPVRAMDLNLSLNGSGNYNLAIEGENIFSRINGSGNIKLIGSAKNQKVTINGSGNVDAIGCPSGSVSVTINGSGDCRVMATSALKVLIRGSGNVYYKGTPDINTEVKGSGSVVKME